MAKLPLHVVFHQDIRLMVFRPRGILGEDRVNTIVEFLDKEEVRAAKPFDRFCDLSKLDAIDLDFQFVFRIALYRRLVYAERPPIKSAFYVTSQATERVVKIHAVLTERSAIDVQIFKDMAEAAKWLGTSVETLAIDASDIKGS
ncbi:MAG: hypothetical protein ACJ8KX_13750 [Chthoniobacterales bacterium]